MVRYYAIASGIMLSLLAATAAASSPTDWEPPNTEAPRLALIVGGWSAEARNVDLALSRHARNQRATVLRRVPVNVTPTSQIEEEIGAIRQRAEEVYFFEGSDRARDYLDAVVRPQLGVTHRWMGDHALAKAHFESGLFLTRALLDEEQPELAREVMAELVSTYPGHRCDDRIFPPGVYQLWVAVVGDRPDDTGTIGFSDSAMNDCEFLINGAPIEKSRIELTARRSYLIGQRCGGAEKFITRWITVGPDSHRDWSGFDAVMQPATAKKEFDRWIARHDLDGVVYVGPGECGAEICIALRVRHGSPLEEVPLQKFDEKVVDYISAALVADGGRSSYDGEFNSPRPWATQIAMSANARRYQVSIYPKWVSEVR